MSRIYVLPLEIRHAVPVASLESIGTSKTLSSPVPIVNIMPKSRMNQIVTNELKGQGWEPGESPSILWRKDSIVELALNLDARTLDATVDVQAVVEQKLSREAIEDGGESADLLDSILEGTVDPVTALLGTEFVPEIESAIQNALTDATSEINENLAGAYRNAMLERANALGRIAKVDESRTEEGLRVRITVQSE